MTEEGGDSNDIRSSDDEIDEEDQVFYSDYTEIDIVGGTVLRESTECWGTSTWKMGHWLKMGLACGGTGITYLLHVLKFFSLSVTIEGEDLAPYIGGLSDCESEQFVPFWSRLDYLTYYFYFMAHLKGDEPAPLLMGEKSGDVLVTGKTNDAYKSNGGGVNISENSSLDSNKDNSEMVAWLESFERQDWISCVWGTSQDAMTSHVVVAAVLAVWYPNLVKPSLAMLCVHPLLKLVMAMNDKYSSAAEILAEGMENTWSLCIASEIPRILCGDLGVFG
ncbi:hypothetical protein Tco_0748522 [Tanacetum coccineum]|uniref:Uncharacterized protein n=1 Tax=Tanacetum coccineum TaxID=301880 RepID=A0ABQ4YWV3_9ASTR